MPTGLRRLRPSATWLLTALLTLEGLLALTFVVGRMIPADPVLLILGDKADQAAYDRVFQDLGLHLPLWRQFLAYNIGVLEGDFGRSIITGNPVGVDIARAFPATVELAVASLLICIAVGVPAGVASAVSNGKPIDYAIRVAALLAYSAPGFWLSLMALIFFYGELGWIPGPGRIDVAFAYDIPEVTGFLLMDSLLAGQPQAFWNAFSHLFMPATILGLSCAAYVSRMTRSFMLEQLGQDFILTATLKGLSRADVIWRHAFRAIGVQLITVLALVFAYLLEGAVLIEMIFAWPGFGRYMTSAMISGDMNAVVASILLVGVIFIIINALADLSYRRLDPRTR